MSGNDHIDEITLELYILRSPRVESERPRIEAHLTKCDGCKELFESISSFYLEIKEDLSKGDNLPVLLGDRVPGKRRYPLDRRYQDLAAKDRGEMGIPFRVAHWISRHPYVSGGGFLMGVGFIAALFFYAIRPGGHTPSDRNPLHAEFKGEMMLVENERGEIIDEIRIGKLAANDLINQSEISEMPLVSFSDADGDGFNEIIWCQQPPLNVSYPSIVFCKSVAQQKILWADTIRRKLIFPRKPEIQGENFKCTMIITGDLDADGQPEVYILATHIGYFSTILLKLNSKDGKEEGVYLNPGTLNSMRQMPNDGVTELILGGINNAFGNGCAVVIDPRLISGHAPSQNDYVTEGFTPGLEKAYIRIPKTIIGEAVNDETRGNEVSYIQIDPIAKLFTVVANDVYISTTGGYGTIYVSFDQNLEAKITNTSDNYDNFAKRLLDQHIIPFKPDSRYFRDFVKKIEYWDGTGWVNQPTFNKNYLEAAARLKQPM